jgi:hypothetical protein
MISSVPQKKKVIITRHFNCLLLISLVVISMLLSCVQGDLYELYDEDLDLYSLAKRTKYNDVHTNDNSGDEYAIADAVLSQSDCLYQALCYIFTGHNDLISYHRIKDLMKFYNNDSYTNYPESRIRTLLTAIKMDISMHVGDTIEIDYYNSNSGIAINDLVLTNNPFSVISPEGKTIKSRTNTGHAYIVGQVSGDVIKSVDRGTYQCDLNKKYLKCYYRFTIP